MTVFIITLHFHWQLILLQNIWGRTAPNQLCINSLAVTACPLCKKVTTRWCFFFVLALFGCLLSVCVFLSFPSLDAMEWNALYVCGIFVRHVFVKAVLVLLSFSPNKTSGLVAHENSTF